jgi:hypothetical protein
MQQQGAQWLKNSAGSWGSSEQALLLLKRGIQTPTPAEQATAPL